MRNQKWGSKFNKQPMNEKNVKYAGKLEKHASVSNQFA